MIPVASWAAMASLLLQSIYALHLTKREAHAPAVVAASLQRRHVADPLERDRLRRRNTVAQPLDNFRSLYFADITLGTPPQNIRVHIDTGSSDLWVNTESSEFCSLQQDPCELSGTYDANSSSTYTYINSVFSISYVDGSQAAGDYVADTFGIGGVELEDLQFAIGYTSTSQEGVMGIGYPSNEVQVLLAFGRPYPNIPELLAQRGFINSNAYSLWLNDLDANTGVILFGGVDTAKYVGELHTLPVVRRRGEYTDLIISMTGLGRGDSPGSIRTDIREHALLDSGASFTYLPADITADLYRSLGAQYDSQTGEALVDCSLAEDSNTLDFTFTTATIAVPLNELVLPVGSLPNGQRVCVLGISPTPEPGLSILGDTFLRSAYVVYDLANNEISLAQTDFNETESAILEITNSPDGVPNARGLGESTAASNMIALSATYLAPAIAVVVLAQTFL